MTVIRLAAVLLCAGFAGHAQLTSQQKVTDLQNLAANFAKRYAPYEWKKELYGVDALKLQPFLERAAATRSDQEFYDLCYEYVAQFRDAHVALEMPSDFSATLGLSVDIYDGRVVIDAIERGVLPGDKYPFQVGDEVVSLDGRTAEEWIETLTPYRQTAEPRSTRRMAAGTITMRSQTRVPTAARLGDNATLVVRRREGGALETYTLPWIKKGTPLADSGPVPDVTRARGAAARKQTARPDPFAPLRPLMYSGILDPRSVTGLGKYPPVFALPSDFKQRHAANLYSGSYQAGGKTIGFLRIPHFEPNSIDEALDELDVEIAWMQANTDGLILDVMHNPGGFGSYETEIARRLIPHAFRPVRLEMRATRDTLGWFTEACEAAARQGLPDWKVSQCRAMLNDVVTAYRENRGRTGPLPLDFLFLEEDVPVYDEIPPAKNVYTKPIIALIDELSFSCADELPAVLQDNGAATLFGYRTAGAGGTVTSHQATTYSEFTIYLTVGLMVRSKTVITPDFPATSYVENVGVRPDIEEDYQTMDNLLNRGKTYVERFTAAMVAAINKK